MKSFFKRILRLKEDVIDDIEFCIINYSKKTVKLKEGYKLKDLYTIVKYRLMIQEVKNTRLSPYTFYNLINGWRLV